MKEKATDDVRVVYDTNVWVSCMLGEEDRFYHSCKPLIEDIEQDRCVAVVSYLIIMESIYAIRRRLTERFRWDGADASAKEALVEERSKKFIDFITELSGRKKIMIVMPEESVAKHHSAILKKLRSLSGYVKLEFYCKECREQYPIHGSTSACRVCGSNIRDRRYKYRGLGHADIEHAYLAVHSRASKLYSTDKGFTALADDPDFASVDFVWPQS